MPKPMPTIAKQEICKNTEKAEGILPSAQTVDKVRGDAADFSCAEVPQIQYLSGVEALFMV